MGLAEYNEEYGISFGVKRLEALDQRTGEVLQLVQKTSIDYGGERYKRVYPSFLDFAFDFADSARTKTLFYILKNLKYKSCNFVCKASETAKKIGISRSSFFEALREMHEKDFIRKIQEGVWMVNPGLVSDLDEIGRQRVMKKYHQLEPYRSKSKGDA